MRFARHLRKFCHLPEFWSSVSAISCCPTVSITCQFGGIKCACVCVCGGGGGGRAWGCRFLCAHWPVQYPANAVDWQLLNTHWLNRQQTFTPLLRYSLASARTLQPQTRPNLLDNYTHSHTHTHRHIYIYILYPFYIYIYINSIHTDIKLKSRQDRTCLLPLQTICVFRRIANWQFFL